ncbi:MAG: CoA transferase [Clostridiales bacterium]|nr:CoA transferase [Candidatus Crickella merdequi]
MNNLCLPLEGVKILELATVVAAPSASRILADYGAEVIKIESPPFGDLSRITGRDHLLPIDDDNNPFFDHLNAGKKLVALNLKKPEGMDIFMKMLDKADIFLTNISSQSLEKLGIDYESLKDKYPKLIYAHFTGLGREGSEANRACYDQTAFWSRTGANRRIPEIVKALEKSFITRTSEQWSALLGEKDVICEVIRHFSDIYSDPQTVVNEMLEEVEYEEGTTHMPKPPVDFIGFDRQPLSKTGALGCDTLEVLSAMGYTDSDIEELRRKKAVL